VADCDYRGIHGRAQRVGHHPASENIPDHKATTTTNPLGMSSMNIFWHFSVHDLRPSGLEGSSRGTASSFALRPMAPRFGYNKVAPWYRYVSSGGPQFDADAGLRLAYNPDSTHVPHTLPAVTTDLSAEKGTMRSTTATPSLGHGQVHLQHRVSVGIS
jgi:hypothetical protein